MHLPILLGYFFFPLPEPTQQTRELNRAVKKGRERENRWQHQLSWDQPKQGQLVPTFASLLLRVLWFLLFRAFSIGLFAVGSFSRRLVDSFWHMPPRVIAAMYRGNEGYTEPIRNESSPNVARCGHAVTMLWPCCDHFVPHYQFISILVVICYFFPSQSPCVLCPPARSRTSKHGSDIGQEVATSCLTHPLRGVLVFKWEGVEGRVSGYFVYSLRCKVVSRFLTDGKEKNEGRRKRDSGLASALAKSSAMAGHIDRHCTKQWANICC